MLLGTFDVTARFLTGCRSEFFCYVARKFSEPLGKCWCHSENFGAARKMFGVSRTFFGVGRSVEIHGRSAGIYGRSAEIHSGSAVIHGRFAGINTELLKFLRLCCDLEHLRCEPRPHPRPGKFATGPWCSEHSCSCSLHSS